MKNAELNAFPIVLQNGLSHNSHVEIGLTKREYFAGLVLQGIISYRGNTGFDEKQTATTCVRIADELLKKLEEV